MSSNQSIRDRIAQNDVTVARSYLEVDVMHWFSQNEIPFAYEGFVIPSVVGPSKDEWDAMVDALQAIGRRNFDAFDNLTNGTRWEDTRPAEVMGIWEDIYDKHELQGEQITVEVRDSLRFYSKSMILPDFTLYPNSEYKTAPDGFDYSQYEYIVEVSGLWGVGLPGESTREDWWDWYRVGAVAYKELAYKLLGLWDDVYWVIPNQPYIEGVSDGLPNQLRDDEHYVIVNTTSADIDLGKLADSTGITAGRITEGLSPNIELIGYDRPSHNELPDNIGQIEWEYSGINMNNVDNNENAIIVSKEHIVFHGELGEVYLTDNTVQVRESQWRGTNMIMLREYVTDVVSQLSEDGIVEGLGQVS